MAGGSVGFGVPPERAYDFLVDPTQRPRWQSSLRAVELLDGWRPGDPVEAGLRWVDVTWPGLRPRMTLTEAERPERWSESGVWRAFSADLTLTFAATPFGCRVHADFEVRAAGVWAPLGRVATAAGVRPVLADLRRAARDLGVG
ncbi:SRPBCC family protein [Nocardioides sp. Y6]|uniref:SRPBCC family protein n=1 Tax=Nocardioides malaquae TaxID=2773426 RepID=A0ABR9RSY3_9ACTN|nr:SRPBCC family protein [Nocardioides malaquae]MBE7324674.1 SRPBCC family protein [Nocardioides malaquae]